MSLRSVTAAEAAAALGDFDAILDARSPAEFAEDHLPGAANWPTLDDAQRAEIGTLYVQDSVLAARKRGAAMAARAIADHLDRWIADKPRSWQPLVYCWRGGQRSGALALVLDQIGFRATRLEGGYKAFRAVVRQALAELPAFDLRVIAGPTGSGKTRLLAALAEAGAQVIDLEALACHRGSVLGGLPHQAQPSQRAFDTRLWQLLRTLDVRRPVFIESESRKVGALQVPEALIGRMHAQGQVLRLTLPEAARVELLMEDYRHFTQDAPALCARLDGLIALRGRETVQRWQAQARAGDWPALLSGLLREHYDPLYQRSLQRHYLAPGETQLALQDAGAECLRAAARALIEASNAPG